ncbi:MAG TPA: O-methyltransferase [Cyclobacteriaceae bacterium]|nr:O-methyltransferase [Cyclobacteriaceae bacterium]
MDFIDSKIGGYAESNTSPETQLLKRINRDTHANVLKPRMLSGHLQGRILSMISHMIKPSAILEIGTYTGYSAICLCEGLRPGGKLVTIERNEELEAKLKEYFKEAGLSGSIDLRIGNALKILPELDGKFDLVFIDADKENYSNYFDLVIEKVPPGGFILADNVLWSGKVVEPSPDKDTRAILAFNDKVHNDPRVENVLIPVRDGIMVMRKV